MFEYEEDEVAQKLYNMMQIADGMRYDRGFAAWFISHGDITNRNKAVNWIKIYLDQVLGVDCPNTRDTSIQILDKFLLSSITEDPNILSNVGFISYSAAASMVIACKMMDKQCDRIMTKFHGFDVDYLIQFEQHVLAVTCCKISALCSPSTFLHRMMELVPNINRKGDILCNANMLIAEFWSDQVSLLYAPSTIAITALLVSFSLLKIPCDQLLETMPLCCFVNSQNPFYECDRGMDEQEEPLSPNAQFLDHDSCIAEFERMETLRSLHRPCTPAPGGLAASSSSTADGGTTVLETAVCSPVSVATQLNSPVSSIRSSIRSTPADVSGSARRL